MSRKQVALSLFWRTFFLLLLLLGLALSAWFFTWRTLTPSQTAANTGHQLASQVVAVRDALRALERAAHADYARGLGQHSGLKLLLRSNADLAAPLPDDRWHQTLQLALREVTGPEVVLAAQVNGMPGLWVGFNAERDGWWLRTEVQPARSALDGWAWLWLVLAGAGTLAVSAVIARRINQPLRELSFAASKIKGGTYDSRLDETNITSEIREVNMGFNRMARELQRVEEDRAVMLAGISHDLRTPLARLRLEAEMSVHDDEARSNMADDIDQLDAIIDKFMDYARPGETHLKPILLARLVEKEASAFRDPSEIQIGSKVAGDLRVQADEVELGRVLANLFENARRYGRSSETGIAMVQVSSQRAGPWVICSVRDHGLGVPQEKLAQLTTPFFRGDAARTAATGAGLGLAIVEKAMQRMGGQVEIANAPDGGLLVHLRLKHAKG